MFKKHLKIFFIKRLGVELNNQKQYPFGFVNTDFVCSKLKISKKSVWMLKKSNALQLFGNSKWNFTLESFLEVKNFIEEYRQCFGNRGAITSAISKLQRK